MQKIAGENKKTKEEVDKEEAEFRSKVKPFNVCVTNAASGIAYGTVAGIVKGEALGEDADLALHLLDTEENQEELEGVRMEAFDLAASTLRGLSQTSDPVSAFKDCSYIVLLDELLQGEEESKEDWLRRNHDHFVHYTKIIDSAADANVKVVVGGRGPVNFNVYMMLKNTQKIAPENIVAQPRLVENHAKAVLAEKLNVNSSGIVDLIVWGNPNGTNFVSVLQARVHGYNGAIWGPDWFSLSAPGMVFDDKWLELVSKYVGRLCGTINNNRLFEDKVNLYNLLIILMQNVYLIALKS